MGSGPEDIAPDGSVSAPVSVAAERAASRLTLANGLTFVRLLAVGPLFYAIFRGEDLLALGLFALAVFTDVTDGRLARRRGEASAFGGALDHTTDALFVSTGLAALACLGRVPVLLPPLVLLAFAQYALDSRVLAGRALRTSVLGRWNGIVYYVLLGIPVVRDGIGTRWPADPVVLALGWLLVASTLVSMVDRGSAWLAIRRARGSRA